MITDHGKIPDVIPYDTKRGGIFFIESVTSVGPMSQKRVNEINLISADCDSGKIFVTASPDKKVFKKFIGELAWGTEVWIADSPDHMIHLNGDRFIGPR